MIEINVAVSNRHVHLTRKDIDDLFGVGYELTVRNVLSQKSDFAANEVVSLKRGNNIIRDVRIVGPVRDYTQVELCKADCEFLKINPPVRDSGDLNNSEEIIIIGPKGEKKVKNACIIAVNHIHANNEELKGYDNGDIVSVRKLDGTIINNVHIKKHNDYSLEMHIDKYNSLVYSLYDGDKVILEKSD